MKVTLDTNVLVSGTFWEGEAFKILELVEQRKVQCVLSKEILAEYDRIMHSDEILQKIAINLLALEDDGRAIFWAL